MKKVIAQKQTKLALNRETLTKLSNESLSEALAGFQHSTSMHTYCDC